MRFSIAPHTAVCHQHMPPIPASLLSPPHTAVPNGTKRRSNETPSNMALRAWQFSTPHVLFPGEHVGHGSEDHDHNDHLRQDTATKTQLSWAGEIVCCIDFSFFLTMRLMMFRGPVCSRTAANEIETSRTEIAKELVATEMNFRAYLRFPVKPQTGDDRTPGKRCYFGRGTVPVRCNVLPLPMGGTARDFSCPVLRRLHRGTVFCRWICRPGHSGAHAGGCFVAACPKAACHIVELGLR